VVAPDELVVVEVDEAEVSAAVDEAAALDELSVALAESVEDAESDADADADTDADAEVVRLAFAEAEVEAEAGAEERGAFEPPVTGNWPE